MIRYVLMTTLDFDELKGLVSFLPYSQDLQRVTQEKLEIQNQLASLNLEFESMKTSSDHLGQEKWELTQVNTDLQQRLQQTVALARMQVATSHNMSRIFQGFHIIMTQFILTSFVCMNESMHKK